MRTLLPFLALAAALLAGCGGSSPDGQTAVDTNQTAAEKAATDSVDAAYAAAQAQGYEMPDPPAAEQPKADPNANYDQLLTELEQGTADYFQQFQRLKKEGSPRDMSSLIQPGMRLQNAAEKIKAGAVNLSAEQQARFVQAQKDLVWLNMLAQSDKSVNGLTSAEEKLASQPPSGPARDWDAVLRDYAAAARQHQAALKKATSGAEPSAQDVKQMAELNTRAERLLKDLHRNLNNLSAVQRRQLLQTKKDLMWEGLGSSGMQ